METYAEIVRLRAEDDKLGLRFEDQQWTWREVVQEAADRAAAVTALVSPAPADRQIHIGVLLENVPDFVFWISAGSLAGAAVVGINASRSGPELAHDIKHPDLDIDMTMDQLANLGGGPRPRPTHKRIFNVHTDT